MPAELKVMELSESVGPSTRRTASWREREGRRGQVDHERGERGVGREGVLQLGSPFLLTLVQRRAGVGRPCTEQVKATLLPRGKESSSLLLSSMGSRSGGGYRRSPSGTLTKLVRGAQGLLWVET